MSGAKSKKIHKQQPKCLSEDQETGKKCNRRKWNKREDGLLGRFVAIFGTKWLQIAEQMGHRSASQCQQRWKRLKSNFESQGGMIKKRWTSAEDSKLLRLHKIFGAKWNKISRLIPNKDRRAVRNRFVNVLDPNINHNQISEQEDILICQLYEKYGSQWTLISKHLPGRSENMIKNRFNYQLKQKYFQKPNLYYIQNSKELRQQLNEKSTMIFQSDKEGEVEINEEIKYQESFNSSQMIKPQDSYDLEGYESNPYFLRVLG